MSSIIFSMLLFNSQYITFDTIRIKIDGYKCGENAKCYYLQKNFVMKFNPKKIKSSTFPKNIKWTCDEDGCWTKIYERI